jgi:hypothetical protein
MEIPWHLKVATQKGCKILSSLIKSSQSLDVNYQFASSLASLAGNPASINCDVMNQSMTRRFLIAFWIMTKAEFEQVARCKCKMWVFDSGCRSFVGFPTH